jgi:hypothetical protein
VQRRKKDDGDEKMALQQTYDDDGATLKCDADDVSRWKYGVDDE